MIIPRALPIWKKRRMKSPGTPNTCRTPRARSASTRYPPVLGSPGSPSPPLPPRDRGVPGASPERIEPESGLAEDPAGRALGLVARERLGQHRRERVPPPARGEEVELRGARAVGCVEEL